MVPNVPAPPAKQKFRTSSIEQDPHMKSVKAPLIAVILTLAVTGCQKSTENTTATAASELPAGITLVESVAKHADQKVSIPYKKYQLENGLTVVLHEDRSDPLVHVDVTYHVGSGREEVGKSGFAHFFEHMMFQGSEHVADEEHFKVITEAGGTLNGTTNTDRTNYFETVPSNQLEKMLWLESDRMGFLLDAVTQEKFEVQRETVKNERGQRVDNRPYGLLGERIGEALYPEGHPYSWSTIGYLEDLNRVDVNDLKKFFLRWYGPNNAVLTIGGDFEETQALAWVNKYFGSIPRGPEVDMPQKPVVTLDKDRYISLEDNVALPLVYMAWPTVSLFHEDEAPLDVLMFALGVGETSLLYKNMVKNGLAVQASANHGCAELACTFTVLALANPAMGKNLAELEQIARDSLEEFETRGVTEDDVERVKMSIISGKIFGLESVSGKVGQLASYQTYTGNPDYTGADVARYENVTVEDVMRVYNKYIFGKPAVIMSIVPEGQVDIIAAADTWSRYERDLPDYMATAETDLEYRRATDDFDRSVMPGAGENPTVTLPAIWRAEMDNGIKILGALNDETPTAAISLRIEAGQRNESVEQLGLASLTASMMNESTQNSSNEELSDRLQKLGSSVGFGAGNNYTTMTIRSLSENLDETISIALERLLLPAFSEEDFARVKSQTLQAIEQGKKDPSSTVAVVYQKLLMGEDNSIAYANIGVAETVQALTLDDVRAFYEEHYSPAISSMIVVSDYSKEELIEKLSAFGGWEGSDVPVPSLKPFPENGKTRLYLVDKPGAAQSQIRIGKMSLTYDATGEFYRAGLSNYALGGAFNSRINLNLREDKGYSYGARSGFDGEKDYGVYTASAGVRTDATAASIIEFEKEIRNFSENGITEPELKFTRSAIGQRDARRYETPGQKLGFLSQIVTYNLDDGFVDEQSEVLARLTQKDVNEIAAKHLNMDEMIIVVVGDKATILPSLQELGYEIVELDADGALVE